MREIKIMGLVWVWGKQSKRRVLGMLGERWEAHSEKDFVESFLVVDP